MNVGSYEMGRVQELGSIRVRVFFFLFFFPVGKCGERRKAAKERGRSPEGGRFLFSLNRSYHIMHIMLVGRVRATRGTFTSPFTVGGGTLPGGLAGATGHNYGNLHITITMNSLTGIDGEGPLISSYTLYLSTHGRK